MINRWLILATLALTLNTARAVADDGWRPAGSASTSTGSNSSAPASGSTGVTLGRPVAADSAVDPSVDKALADSNFTRASYVTPGALPSVVRSQSPEVPQPLPSGPSPKSATSASPVSRSTSGFAGGPAALPEPSSGIFASDQPKSDAPLESVPMAGPHPNLVPESAGSDCSSGLACNPCDARACDCTCGDPCHEPNRLYISGNTCSGG